MRAHKLKCSCCHWNESVLILVYLFSQKQIKDKLNVATPKDNFLWSFRNELPPIIIAVSQFFRRKYVYISADSIVKVLYIHVNLFTRTYYRISGKIIIDPIKDFFLPKDSPVIQYVCSLKVVTCDSEQ